MSLSQRDLLSAAAAVLGCGERPTVINVSLVVASALDIHLDDVENAPVLVALGDGPAYLLGEGDYDIQIMADFPPPLDLDNILSTHSATTVVIIQHDETRGPFGESHDPNGVLVRRVHVDIIAKGAALLAFSYIPQSR